MLAYNFCSHFREWIDGSSFLSLSHLFSLRFSCSFFIPLSHRIVYLGCEQYLLPTYACSVHSVVYSLIQTTPTSSPSSFSIIFIRAFETSESLPNDDLIFLDCINCLFALFARLVLIFFLNISTVLCAMRMSVAFLPLFNFKQKPVSFNEKWDK